MPRKSAENRKGFIQNSEDGGVYLEAEGEEANLEKFIEWCRKGPVGAKVENITVEEIEIKNFTSFEIQHY